MIMMQMALAIIGLLAWLGLMTYRIGVSRSKNSVSTATRAVCGLFIAALCFWALGEAILYPHRGGIFGISPGLLFGWEARPSALVLPCVALFLAAGIAEASLIERGTFYSAMVSSAAIGLLVVPIAWFWAASGWLYRLGFLDLAGASWLHVSAAVWAGIGAYMLGPRNEKYNHDGSTNAIPGHSVPMAVIGVGMLLIGQIGLIAAFSMMTPEPLAVGGDKVGSALLAAAGGGAAGLAMTLYRFGKPDIMLILGSLLGGAISTSAGDFSPSAAVTVGIIGGLLIPLAASLLDLRRLDDPTGGISTHGIAGAWGTLAAALFASSPASGRWYGVGVQLLGLAAIVIMATALAFATFAILRHLGKLRVRQADEIEGLDLAEHDIAAYPDFQQNTIRSYHLREA